MRAVALSGVDVTQTQHPTVGESNLADRAFHATLARFSGGISPIALLLAYTDWLSHLAASPQRQLENSQEAVRDAERLLEASQQFFAAGHGPWSLIKPQPQDRRFARPEWEAAPFNLFAQAFLLGEQWCHNVTTGVRGVAKPNEAIVERAGPANVNRRISGVSA
ncbi:poly-beta-hydroxybutyrate polymerase N-terminal domain-containing protein [Bradyrhizobium sp. LB13.1]